MIAQPSLEHEAFKTTLEKFLANNDQAAAWQKARLKAWDHFLQLGLPNRRTELYRYIKVRHLFAQSYDLPPVSTLTANQIAPYVQPECKKSLIVFVNGDYQPLLSCREAIPEQVFISNLEEAALTYGTFLNNQWTKSLKEEQDPFVAINGAVHRQGAFVYIPPKTVIEAPIQILHLIQTENQLCMLAPRLNVFAGAHSQVTFLAPQKQLSAHGYFINQVVEMALEENAHVHYNQVLCDEHPTAWHLDALRATLKRNATLKTVCVTEGSMTVRSDYHVVLAGENAEVFLNGVWMLKDKREAHTNVFIEHQAPNCRSFQLFKGVLNDFSRSSFEGKIMVRQAAQKTEAFQRNDNLILSDHAHADSKPNLEIFADDVKASHGATVGQLDQDQLFYMKTRGFDTASAKNLLIYGFCEQVIEMLSVASIKQMISAKAKNYLKG